MALDWKLIFNRRGMKLEVYVSSCRTVDEALDKFKREGLEPPPEEEIIAAMGSISSAVPPESNLPSQELKPESRLESEPVNESPEVDKRLVESPRKLDELVVL